MPRPHFPVRGGAHAQPRYAGVGSTDVAAVCEGCKEKNAELERVRQELSHARSKDGAARRFAGPGMMWMALGVCGIGLLFALAAILHHG